MTLISSLFSGISNAKLRWCIVLFFSCLGAASDFYLFYPGFISPDTLDQFRQALYNSYGNWHPPTMAAIWHLLLPLWCGPQPMLLLQLIFLWLGFAFLFDIALHRNKPAALFLLLVMLSPFVQNVAGNVWKDLHMSLSWFLAFAWISHAWYWKRRIAFTEFILCLLLITYGTWVRLSGFPATLPILFFLWKNSTLPQKYRSSVLAATAALAISFFSLKLEKLVSANIINAHNDYIEYKLILHDLSGLSIRTGKDLFPATISTWYGFNWDYITKNYHIESFDNVWWNPDNLPLFPGLSEEQHKELQKHWRQTILQNAGTYLKLKFDGSLYFLRIKNSGTPFMIMYPEIYKNNFGIALPNNSLRDLLFKQIEIRKDKPYMKPLFWLLLNAFLYIPIVLFRKNRFTYPAFLFNLSASLYLAIHFFVFPADTEFRYFYWYSLSISTAAFFMLACIGSKEATD